MDQSHLSCFNSLIFIIVSFAAPKKCMSLYYRPYYRLRLQNGRYKFCNRTLFIRQMRKIKHLINLSSKFIMLTYNNQIFRNCFVIIHRHLTKVSARINKCIIFEPTGLSITVSTLWLHLHCVPRLFVICRAVKTWLR